MAIYIWPLPLVCLCPLVVGFGYKMEGYDNGSNLITQDFVSAATLTLDFDASLIPSGSTADDMIPVYYSTVRDEWIAPDGPVLVDNGKTVQASGQIAHF